MKIPGVTVAQRDGGKLPVRVNEWFSAYAMVVAYSRVSTFSGDYLRVTDNKGKNARWTGSDDGRHSKHGLAGAGVKQLDRIRNH